MRRREVLKAKKGPGINSGPFSVIVDGKILFFEVGLVGGNFFVTHHRLFLQPFIIKVLTVEYCGRIVAGDAILDHQGGNRCL